MAKFWGEWSSESHMKGKRMKKHFVAEGTIEFDEFTVTNVSNITAVGSNQKDKLTVADSDQEVKLTMADSDQKIEIGADYEEIEVGMNYEDARESDQDRTVNEDGSISVASFVTGTPYVQFQFKVLGDCLHVQGAGPEVNRKYGVAENVDLNVFATECDWWREVPQDAISLTGSGVAYANMRARLTEDGDVKIQVASPTPVNRTYGLSACIDGAALPLIVQFLQEVAD